MGPTANSVVAKYLGLGSPSHLPLLIMLGLTSYPHGHPFGTQFLRFAGNGFAVGRLPVTENLVHFFVSRPSPSTGITTESAAREYVLEKLQDCPDEIADMVRRCDAAETKTLTKVWYRSPWQVLLGRFQRGTVTVAGDAMHVMGPYIGQGGSAALEDAVVLARTLSRSVPEGVVAVVHGNGSTRSRELQEKKISAALGEYVRERRARLFMLSLESYVIGTLRMAKSLLKKIACVAMLTLLGSESRRHANCDCGPL
jgi:2-polyprenyl-6-methoxyphenol hydroxylase-like FAD-dependent oxidoreductase